MDTETQIMTEWVGRMIKEHGRADEMKVVDINPDSGTVKLYIGKNVNRYITVALIVMDVDA